MVTLERFKKTLPKKPFCADYYEDGLKIRPKNIALKHRHIQYNPPKMAGWIAFDIDSESAGMDWYDNNGPPPNIVIQNPDNGHCHYLYSLENPVCISVNGRMKPLRFLSSIEKGLTNKLKADPGYTGHLVKNPFSDAWRIWTPRQEPYSLDELFDYVDSTQLNLKTNTVEVRESGRNVEIFDRLRFWAYERVAEAKKGNFESWLADITEQALDFNVFTAQLDFKEVATIARSVAKWTWTNYSGDRKNRGVLGFGENRYTNPDMAQLTDDQKKYRQSSGARYTNTVRKATTEAKIKEAIAKLRLDGKKPTKAAVARLVGISRVAVSKHYGHLFEMEKV